MDLKQIEKLMSAMERTKIKRVVLKQEGFEIELERETYEGQFTPFPSSQQPSLHYTQSEHASTPVYAEPEEKNGGYFVTSPIVGTFYSSPSPEDPPFVKVGDAIDDDDVVCIVEAMKVMNEVKAGISGTITEILVKNGDPVEFGTKIFRIQNS